MVPLPEETSYHVSWGYVKDSSERAGADAGWIDEVRVDGTVYEDIALNEPEAVDTEWFRLSWATIPCRHYQVFWRPLKPPQRWEPMISKVGPATGVEGSILERRKLFGRTRVPRHAARAAVVHPDAAIARVRADPGRPVFLVYGVEGSVPFRYRWYSARLVRIRAASARCGGRDCDRFGSRALGIEDCRVEGAGRRGVFPGCGERGGS